MIGQNLAGGVGRRHVIEIMRYHAQNTSFEALNWNSHGNCHGRLASLFYLLSLTLALTL
jgi:hypothetical protein